MLGEQKNQFSITGEALSTRGHAKSNFLSVFMKNRYWALLLGMYFLILSGFTNSFGIALIDLDPFDSNRILHQEEAGDLIVQIKFGDSSRTMDSILVLNSDDLANRLAGLWLQVDNSTPDFWNQYRIEFYDRTFTKPLGLSLNSFLNAPTGFSESLIEPRFNNAQVISLGGFEANGDFQTIFTFFPNFSPNQGAKFEFGIRQIAKVPDTGSAMRLLLFGSLPLLLVGRNFCSSFCVRND